MQSTLTFDYRKRIDIKLVRTKWTKGCWRDHLFSFVISIWLLVLLFLSFFWNSFQVSFLHLERKKEKEKSQSIYVSKADWSRPVLPGRRPYGRCLPAAAAAAAAMTRLTERVRRSLWTCSACLIFLVAANPFRHIPPLGPSSSFHDTINKLFWSLLVSFGRWWLGFLLACLPAGCSFVWTLFLLLEKAGRWCSTYCSRSRQCQ